MPLSPTSLLIVESDRSRPVGDGKTNPLSSEINCASASNSSTRPDNDTRCSRFIFMGSAGTLQIRSSRSISDHRAPRTSLERQTVKTKYSKASFEAGHAFDTRTFVSASPTSA